MTTTPSQSFSTCCGTRRHALPYELSKWPQPTRSTALAISVVAKFQRRCEVGFTELNEFLTAATDCEPTPPQDSRPNQTDCDCRFCLEMQTFLASPSQETTRIAAREDRSQHLVDVIRSKNLMSRPALKKHSSPHKLVLTKTSGSYDRALKQYSQRSQVSRVASASRRLIIIDPKHRCVASGVRGSGCRIRDYREVARIAIRFDRWFG